MLQTQTVSPELLELLKFIMKSEVFSDFILVGGTSLALQIGHRNSVDIDMFGNCEINEEVFINELKKFGNVDILSKSKNIIITSVNEIKVDFVNHFYPFLDEKIEVDGIRLASKKDIAAMKLNAISGRGSKKDFIDLYFLFQDFSLNEMFQLYDKKYEEDSYFLVMKSITYFDDADEQESPKMYIEFDWENAKQKILHEFNKL